MVARHYFPHIYFEAIGRGRDSVFQAVRDRGEPGLSSRREFIELVFAQLLDVYDGKTRDHRNRKVEFTVKLWNGRTLVLRRLNARKKFRCKKLIQAADKLAKAYLKGEIDREEFLAKVKKLARKYKVKNIKQLLKKVNR